MYITEYYFFTSYLGILMIAFMLASVVFVIMEMPFMNLDKLLFPNSREIKKSKFRFKRVIGVQNNTQCAVNFNFLFLSF